MTEPGSVLLSARCLLSKWGFGDGDAPDGYLDWLDEQGLAYPTDWHATLRRLVRDRLMPLVSEDVRLVDISTSHNPVRAKTVNGREVDWYDGPDDMLGDVFVEVPYREVHAVQVSVDG